MHWRRFSTRDIPYDDAAKFETWLLNRWREKDDLLEHYQQTGRFPGDEGQDTRQGQSSPDKALFGAGHIETEVRPVHFIETLQIVVPLAAWLLSFSVLWKVLRMVWAVVTWSR
jgi:lysocardiolipin and lysophospholipid acyltransferase